MPDLFNAAGYFVDRNVAEGRGSAVAIECGDERVTYRDLLERVNRAGGGLRRRFDLRIEERVALVLLDGPEFIYSFFGAIKIGAVPVPANTLWKAPDYEYLLNDSRARILIVSAGLLPQIDAIPRSRLRYLKHVVVVGDPGADRDDLESFASVMAAGDAALDAEPTCRDDAAFWLYSSGSTGFPKGCVHLHRDMPFCAQAYAQGVLRINERDRCFSVAKLFFAYGLGNAMYFPFSVGATAILWPGAPTAANVYSVIERHEPTLFFSVPTNYGMLLAHARPDREFDLSSVRCAVSAGEALPPALYERFKARFGIDILDGIGSTEILHIFISNRPGQIKPGTSGVLVPGYEARIVDEDNQPVRAGEIGNLLIKGDSICAGYWNQHDKSRETIEGPWIRTGDKYFQDHDGYFCYAGRSDDMLKVGGLWVSPVDVENVLMEHPVVLECGVVARCDHDRLVKPAAYVVLRDGVTGSPDLAGELQQFVRTRLADYKRPRWVEFVPCLPKTATGKIQRFRLRGMSL
jgi:benzoate-CoA ligase